MVAAPFLFYRPALAQQVAADIAGEGLQDFSSGLFLAAPRRTGKSTFIKSDLIPAARERDWLVVYTDLWENMQLDPGYLIENAVVRALRENQSPLRKTFQALGVKKVTLHNSISFDVSDEELPAGATLTDALTTLHHATGKLILLIVDEAQHALNTDRGVNTMFALKAARDALNLGASTPGIRMAFTGSSRDKLAQLVLGREQPFFGAAIMDFPLLGDDFVAAYTAERNEKLATHNALKVEDMKRAFAMVGHRPEMLRDLVNKVAAELGEGANLGELLEQGALRRQAGVFAEYEALYDPLTPLQKAVLLTMAQATANQHPFAAFSKATRATIGAEAEALGGEPEPSPQAVQRALESLRTKQLIWKSGRGAYALEDNGIIEWLLQ